MTDKFHCIKFWNEKSSRVTKREYISVEAVEDFINQQSNEDTAKIILDKLEKFISK